VLTVSDKNVLSIAADPQTSAGVSNGNPSTYGTGVAIESTCEQLRSALPDWIFIHDVEYIDYKTDRVIEEHSLAPAFYKRKEFADERELRAVIDVFPGGAQGARAPRLCS
jgi:hypothetical protein